MQRKAVLSLAFVFVLASMFTAPDSMAGPGSLGCSLEITDQDGEGYVQVRINASTDEEDIPLSWVLGWGDGSEIQGTHYNTLLNTTRSHTYAGTGDFNIDLWVQDLDGEICERRETVSISEPTPTPTPEPECCGSLFVGTNNSSANWCINRGVGCGSGTFALYDDLPYDTYTITVGGVPGYNCSSDVSSRQITETNPDKGFTITCTVTGPGDQAPVGNNDGYTAVAITTQGGGIIPANSVYGWSFDPDHPSSSNQVHLYFDGLAGCGGCPVFVVPTDIIRGDVNVAYGITGNHGYAHVVSPQFCDGLTHTVNAYGINLDVGNNTYHGQRSFSCTTDTTPPTVTMNAITSPRNTNLGTISGTANDNVAVVRVDIIIRDISNGGCLDWNGTAWAGCGISLPATLSPVGGGPSVTWSYNATSVGLTNGHDYRIYVLASDGTNGSLPPWEPNRDVLFDNVAPTCTIVAYPNPTTDTRLTSSGSPNGTITGTCQDPLPGGGLRASNINRYLGTLREWNGASPPYNPACFNTNYRDWNNGWLPICGAVNFDTAIAPTQSVNWSTTNTPQTASMTALRYYMQYAQAVDAAGNGGFFWFPAPLTQYMPNVAPITSSVRSTEPDYCSVGPSITASWVYTDPAPSTAQSAYQVQVDDNAGFASPNFDSGKLLGNTTSYYVSSGMTWGTVYRLRVRTWDGTDIVSPWTEQSLCTGPPGNPSGCSGDNKSWNSPRNQYPTGMNTFTWTPTKPAAGDPVQFDDGNTVCYKTPPNTPDICVRWDWTWGDGTPGVNQQNPTHTYANFGAFNVTLRAQDQQNGYACSASKIINIQKPIPDWKEVLPR